ncbi:unnamed protein product [Diplocarpon coronariae]
MDRAERLPTRVSKACDRCKSQKKRCDLERPCRHCVRAQTECTIQPLPNPNPKYSTPGARKSKARRQSVAPTPATQPQPPDPPRPHSQHANDAVHSGAEGSEKGVLGEKTSPASDSQTPRPALTQRARENANLPGFDADSALAMARKIFGSQKSPAFKDRATSAIPGGGCRDTNGTNSSSTYPAPLIPAVDLIGIELPGLEICNKLLETYFSAVHWFSLVVYEPKFRARYIAVVGSGLASRSDRGFLLLLLMLLIMGCWYTPKHKTQDLGLSAQEMEGLRSRLLAVVQRDFMELMDEDSLEFVQVCALLGSFYLYHGRPRSSFSILGAATKTSQAMDLHRDSSTKRSFEDTEERRRVWWTIYTWDRFATITYGRPLGINSKDCNVPMPSEILENVHFDPSLPPTLVCLSTYQYRLNQVYRIASPLLEDIYGMRTSHHIDATSKLPEMASVANRALLEWHQELPRHLSFDQLDDLTAYSSPEEEMHSLQAMSLQLTYDNLVIIIHRPLLAAQGQAEGSADTLGTSPSSQFSDDVRAVAFKRCLSSALRISNLQRKQNLFTLARSSHLVSFLGMNLFTASVVLFICALSDTLSDTAQEAKRGLKRTLQMQKALSTHASLSLQCSVILEDLVQLILKREMEEMLRDNSIHAGTDLQDTAQPGEQSHMDGVQTSSGPCQSGPYPGVYPTAFAAPPESTSHPEGSHFTQSLRTLQRVFHDSTAIRHPAGPDDLVTPHDYGNFAPNGGVAPGAAAASNQDAGPNDSMFTRVEDLGQFWLWDVGNMNY